MGADRAVGIALRVHALVQDPVAVDTLEEAVVLLERSLARLEHAYDNLGVRSRRRLADMLEDRLAVSA